MDARVGLLYLWAVLVLLTAELKRADAADVYTNTWAVQIHGGPEEADRVAREHGFTNIGNVSFTLHCITSFFKLKKVLPFGCFIKQK